MIRLFASGPRYLAVSVFAMIANTALLIALDRLGTPYVVSVLASAAILIPLTYALHTSWTYRTTGSAGTFGRYFSTQIVNTPVALALFFIIHDRLALPMMWAAPAVIGLMFVYNILSSFWAIALAKPHTR